MKEEVIRRYFSPYGYYALSVGARLPLRGWLWLSAFLRSNPAKRRETARHFAALYGNRSNIYGGVMLLARNY
jgi:hypothetical protein